MTGEQAQVILDRLCILFRYEPKGGPQAWGREAEEWIVQLAPIPFEVAEEAVQRIARDERFRFMPTIPEFLQYIDEMRQQGVANAPGPAASATVDAFSLWRQEQLESMTDQQYWEYLVNPQYRERKERDWREQWARMHAVKR